jgi:xylem cysteine proteinase
MKAILGMAMLAAIAGTFFMTRTTSELSDDQVSSMFEEFISFNRRSYASLSEYNYRLGVFKKNLEIAAEI